ncbi:MAG: hypothetical protein GY807_04590 [Gammaproteobacteria bacterium]|nr:hypothetical protein [Gammaproteobacteria bacterium]
MELQGRNLSEGMGGDDVKLLHQELQQLGYTISLDEVEQGLYDGDTIEAVMAFQQAHNLQQTGVVDEETAKRINAASQPESFVVRGKVRQADGRPLAGAIVHAFDRDMRYEQLLGQTTADAAGGYHIAYMRQQFRRAEKERADLVIRMVDEYGNEIAASDIVFNAEPDQTIDLTLQPGQSWGLSEYERYREELASLIENVPQAELTAEDLAFLSGETGISAEHLRHLRLDAQWSEQRDVEQAVFYGLFRQGLPTNYHRLLAEKPSRLREALKASIEQNIIPGNLADNLDDILKRLQTLAVEAAFEPDDRAATPPLGLLLNTAPDLDEERQHEFVSFTLRYEDDDEGDFWNKLREETNLDDEAVGSVLFTLESVPLLHSHRPTLQAVQTIKVNRGWSKVHNLATLNRAEVLEITAQTAANNPPQGFENHESYAEAISYGLEVAFPTAVVAHGLSQDPDLGSADLNVFFQANQAFDLLRTPIKDFLNNGAVLDNVQDRDTLQNQLLETQRVLRVVPERNRFANLKYMSSQGYTSAFAVMRTGQATFVETMTPTMGEAAAIHTYQNARARAEFTQMFHQQLGDYLTSPLPVIPHLRPRTPEPEGEGEFRPPIPEPEGEFPTWVDLFGSLNACACEHCRSMYSPAAYMVELLSFLNEAPELELLSRRSDLQHIKLNCANASTAMPYIDLVNEILEEAVAPFADEHWASYQTPDADGESKAEVEARLRARPEYEHSPAYGRLENAVHPWLLPFSLNKEKIRLFAQHLGLNFVHLYQVFGRSDDWVTQAYLQLTNTEWERLITPAPDDTRVWGDEISLSDLSRVPIFLKQSGLTYEALSVLINTSFLSVEGTPIIELNTGADPCDINDDTLSGLDAPILDRIHRCLRLRQTLDWTISDLDAALAAFGHTDITASALGDIVRIQRLADTYRQPVGNLVMLDGTRLADLMRLSEVEANLFVSLTGREDVATLPLRDQLQLLYLWQDFHSLGFELRELAYILQGRDQIPAVFTPVPADLEAFLRVLHKTVAENEKVQLIAAQADIETAVNEHTRTLPADISDEARATALREFRNDYVEALKSQFAKDAIVQNVAQFILLPLEVVERLIVPPHESTEALIEAQSTIGIWPPETEPAITDFLDLMREVAELPAGSRASWDEPGSSVAAAVKTAYDNVVWLLIRLDRVARLLNRLKITRPELDAIVQTQTENGFLDLNQLRAPHNRADHTQDVLYEQWFALVKAKQVQRALPRAEHDLFDFLIYAATTADTAAAMIDYLAEYTGWNSEPRTGEPVNWIEPLLQSLEQLAPTDALDLALFRRVETYAKLHQTIAWLRRWRITPDELALWVERDPDPARITALAGSLEATAYARFSSDEAWYKTLTPVMDKLREQKRDALLAYLIGHPPHPFKTPSDVYAHYLIDVEMSSCMLTSRIKQANASIQLFVQRILMSLETDAGRIASDDDYWKRWDWIKYYRVWEANRKVFLYPENWIEPELRDDKSPFFKELENELLQDEVNGATVERAFRHYLEKLDEVARLDVCSLYHEEDRQVLHTFARTFSEPHIYYHRYKDTKTGVWAAWKKIEINIEGDHLIPVVHNGRLFLFWAVFMEKDAFWDINIFWSEYKNGKWSSRKSRSNKPLFSFELRDVHISERISGFPRSSFFFRILRETDELQFLLYTSHFAFILDSDRPIGTPFDAPQPYSIAAFTFDECTQELRVKEDINRVQFLALPPGTKPDYTHLNAEDEYVQIYRGLGSPDFLSHRPLSGFYSPDITEQIRITLAEYQSAFNALWVDAIRLDFVHAAPDQLFRDPITVFSLVPDHQSRQFTAAHPFFISLDKNTFLVRRLSGKVGELVLGPISGGYGEGPTGIGLSLLNPPYQFELFYHPYLCDIIKRFYTEGFDGLLKPISHSRRSPGGLPVQNFLDRQVTIDQPSPLAEYGPTNYVSTPLPKEEISFDLTDSYAQYNWELFFHIPLLVATRLSQNQRFEEAQRWFHYIFDPTEVSIHPKPAKYWRVKPFFELAHEPIETLSDLLRKIAAENEQALEQIQVWRDDPFSPHHIARLRNIAYMKNVVIKYLDNLIAWGDYLFQLDTMETINEATQLFILAAELLGKRPVTIKQIDLPEFTYSELTSSDRLDALNNAWIDLESESRLPAELDGRLTSSDGEPLRLLPYFCIPANDKLFAYWDTVADRLFKIRYCMNIEGQVRQLPLFEPPIDPALLVRARAAGLDLRTVFSLTGEVALPHYRYTYTSQKALEFCNEVRSLGNALLPALEKKDAEKLVLLRSRHEMTLLTQGSLIKKKQIEEAKETLDSLHNARKPAEERLAYYSSREFINSNEQQHLDQLGAARDMEAVAEALSIAASIAHLIPDFNASGVPGTIFGGSFIGNSLRGVAGSFSFVASERRHEGSKASIMGGFNRRQDDEGLQATLAEKELAQIDKQIAAADIRLAIAEQDLTNHKTQLDQAREVNDYMRSKFTNQELYGWMAGQLSALHYQAYQLAVDLARKAERAARHELGVSAADFQFIGFEHRDSQKKGLLAGERLNYELRRMDAAFMEQHKRRLELTKHISLAMLNPTALLQLKETGRCLVDLPETLFDLDYAGHFNRRIKSVSLTVPCVTGPYTTVSCTLTLQRHSVRVSDTVEFTGSSGNNYARTDSGDTRFRDNYSSLHQSIAMSNAQNDSGLFELNFRDERYLPFEGAGVISQWQLELPNEFRQFDYDTISDVILHFRYTAQPGSDTFKGAANAYLTTVMQDAAESGLAAMFSAKRDFPNAWYAFLHPDSATDDQTLTLPLNNERFPFLFQGKTITINKIELFIKVKPDFTEPHPESTLKFTLAAGDTAPNASNAQPDDILVLALWNELVHGEKSVTDQPGNWTINAWLNAGDRLNEDALEDVVIVCHYTVA